MKSSNDLDKKLEAIEKKLHNPKAESSYDILAMKGGAMLYSRLSPLMDFVREGEGAPTQGMKEVHTAIRTDLDALESQWQAIVAGDLAQLNQTAQAQGMPVVYLSAGK